ncbi:hypothetical protein Tco_1153452 [Tanacetum coccineum]
MDNSRLCRDMMSNLFTPADQESFNEGMRNESAIKRSWKLLCQSAQQIGLREMEEEKKETGLVEYMSKQTKYAVEAGNGEMATPNVDPASSDTFMGTYEQLFDKRYSYVDKVAHMYLLDPIGLQTVMPDETGPTPGGGPRDTPTSSYA